jgi:hypothetical protein
MALFDYYCHLLLLFALVFRWAVLTRMLLFALRLQNAILAYLCFLNFATLGNFLR